MSKSENSQIKLSDPVEGEPVEYRAVSGLAIVALLFGLISIVAMINLLGWVLPLLGAIASIAALVRIGRSGGTLAGRWAALAGLALCTLFGAAAAVDFWSTEWMLNRRAEQLAEEWFAALAHGEPQVAHQLESGFMQRARVSDREQVWAYYRSSAERRHSLEAFVKEPLIRTLLALDGRAKVRFYEALGITTDERHNAVVQAYAVTFEDGGERKTFFVGLTLERSTQRGSDRVDWRVANSSVMDRR